VITWWFGNINTTKSTCKFGQVIAELTFMAGKYPELHFLTVCTFDCKEFVAKYEVIANDKCIIC